MSESNAVDIDHHLKSEKLREHYRKEWRFTNSKFAKAYDIKWPQYIGKWLRHKSGPYMTVQVEGAVKKWLKEEESSSEKLKDRCESNEYSGEINRKVSDEEIEEIHSEEITPICQELKLLEHSETITIFSYNIGGQNYKEKATTDNLEELIRRQNPDLAVLTEVSSVKAGDALRSRLQDRYEGLVTYVTRRSDSYLILYLKKKFYMDDDYYVSVPGKYVETRLTRIGTLGTFSLVACHLPHKSGRDAAYRVLSQWCRANKRSEYILAGDFNLPPTEISRVLLVSASEVALSDEAGATTPCGRKIDNVVSHFLVAESTRILSEVTYSDHYPIVAVLSVSWRHLKEEDDTKKKKLLLHVKV